MISKCGSCHSIQNNLPEKSLTYWPKTENVFQRDDVDFFHFKRKTFLFIFESD